MVEDPVQKVMTEQKDPPGVDEKERPKNQMQVGIALAAVWLVGLFALFFIPPLLFDRVDLRDTGFLGGLVLTAIGGIAVFVSWTYFSDKDTPAIYRRYREELKRALRGEDIADDLPGKPVVFFLLGVGGALLACRGLGDIWLPLEIVAVLALLVLVGVWFARLPDVPEAPKPAARAEPVQPQEPPNVAAQAPAAAEDPIQTALDKVYGQLKK